MTTAPIDRPDLSSARPEERRHYIDGLWGQVHYREHAGAGHTLVLLHQSPWSSLQFHRAAPLLATLGFRVIALDTPGYGLSCPPPSPPGIADYADNTALVLERLGLHQPTVLGHHTGALIAASLAARHPQSVGRIILDNAPCYSPDERAARQALPHATTVIAEDGAHLGDRWRFLRSFVDPDMTAQSLHLAIITYFSNTPDADHGHPAAYAYEAEADIAAISCPVTVVASRNDSLYPHGRRWLNSRPDWNYVELEGGSASVLEHPHDWARVIFGFAA